MYMQILLNRDVLPSKEFDWNKHFIEKDKKKKEELMNKM